MLATLVLLLTAFTLSGCKAQTSTDTGPEVPPAKIPKGTLLSLTLTGYNYTNRYIDEFSVDGNGGGNLFISSPTSGGGGSACCVRHLQGHKADVVRVRWQSGGCLYSVKSDLDPEVFDQIHSFYKEADVQVDQAIPERPEYFEVHFYPDGHMEAFITESFSDPRLVLSETRKDNSKFPRCPNDKKPEK